MKIRYYVIAGVVLLVLIYGSIAVLDALSSVVSPLGF